MVIAVVADLPLLEAASLVLMLVTTFRVLRTVSLQEPSGRCILRFPQNKQKL